MKTTFTFRRWVYLFVFLCFTFLTYSVNAQQLQAKCAGFTAKITNGSVLNLCSGSSITLSAEPANTGYTFQWQVQTTAGGPFVSIAGATGASYSSSGLGAYRVYISTGSCVDTSGITSLVRITPDGGKITSPATNTICVGAPGGLIKGNQVAGVDVGIITYTWESNEDNAGWTTINLATNLNYNVGPLAKTTAFRRVSNDNCGNKAYSNIVTLTVAPALMAGTINPMSQTIALNSTPATISSATPATGGSNSYTYQWQSSIYERGTFVNIPGATGASYSPGTLNQTTYYRRVVTDTRCLNTAESPVAIVTVLDEILDPGAFTIGSSCIFPGGTPAPFKTAYEPKGGVPPYQVEWQSSTDNVNFTSIPGANGSIYQPGTLTQTTYFRKKVTDAAGTVAYSGSEQIAYISTTLTGGTIKAASNVACLGSAPAEITSTAAPTGYGEDLVYQWQYMNASSGGWKDIEGQIREGLIPAPITEKTTFRRLAIDRCGINKREASSNEVVIDVKPALIAGDIEPTSQMVRPNGTPLPLNSVAGPSGGTGSYTISWENADLAIGPWSVIDSVNTSGYQPPAVTESRYFRRVVMDNNCLATKYTYVVEVFVNKADPLMPCHLEGSNCVFPGQIPGRITDNMPVMGGVPPYTYTWEIKPVSSNTWTLIAGANSANYQPELITETTQYRRKVTDAVGEFAYNELFTIEYHTDALQPGSIGMTSSNVVCSGSTPGLIVSTASVSGYGYNPVYQWQTKTEGGTWTDIPGANVELYQPGPLTQRTYFRRAVTDICSGVTRTVYSNEVVFDLPVAIPLHAGLVDGPFITCAGTAPGTIKSVLDACGSSTPLNYQWEVMQNGSWVTIAGATSASYTPGAIDQNTTYRRKITDACGNSGYSNQVEIFVYPPIEPGVIGNVVQSVCINEKPENIKLLTDCHYTDGTVTYQWQSATSNSGPWVDISGANGPEYAPAASATSTYYHLMVKSTTCSFVAYTNVASVLVNTACGAAAPIAGGRAALNPEVKVYPNPLTGNTIKVEAQTKGKVSVRLMNAEGRAVPVSVSQSGTTSMNLSFLRTPSKGMYLLTVSDENGIWTKKIIVQ